LDVRYEDNKLQKLCTDEREMRRKRSDIAKKLRLRVNALEIAGCVGELTTLDPLGDWHQLSENLSEFWAGKLSENYRLLVRPEDAGDEPWRAVRLTVAKIDDYH
jgi:proteic killer suppression protein